MLYRVQSVVFLFASLLLLSLTATAAPLISAQALKDKIKRDDLVIIDFQPSAFYQKAHIPGAVNTDYSIWRLTNDQGLGKMLPSTDMLAALIGGLGIDKRSEVVIAPVGRGAGDLAAAARIYWTLYVAGLENISILDGGLIAYYQKYGIESLDKGAAKPVNTKSFIPKLRRNEILDIDQVAQYLVNKHDIVDARSPDEFIGKIAGSATERPGALPSAVNLPYDSLMTKAADRLLDIEQLKARFKKAAIPLTGEQLSYCHTGHRTSLVWFVAHELLGNTSARLYDGSTLEWSATSDRPLVLQ